MAVLPRCCISSAQCFLGAVLSNRAKSVAILRWLPGFGTMARLLVIPPRDLPVSNSASQSQHPTKSASAAGQQRPQQALGLMIGSMVGMVQTGRHDRATHGWSNF
jgi:hypothetical protein